jgi:hypothetical protein
VPKSFSRTWSEFSRYTGRLGRDDPESDDWLLDVPSLFSSIRLNLLAKLWMARFVDTAMRVISNCHASKKPRLHVRAHNIQNKHIF